MGSPEPRVLIKLGFTPFLYLYFSRQTAGNRNTSPPPGTKAQKIKNMKIKALLLLSFFIFSSSFTMGQTTKGYIISVENGQVYVDLTNVQVKVGDRIDVSVSGGYMTHPVTGKRIKKGDEQIGSLEIGETFSEYSVGSSL